MEVFGDVPSRTHVIEHDIVLKGSGEPIKQHPYRLNPMKREVVYKEVQYMLDNDFIEPSESPWSSPIVLVPKPDQSYRMCIDFRKINQCTQSDCYPCVQGLMIV